jgi:hypothetical protein
MTKIPSSKDIKDAQEQRSFLQWKEDQMRIKKIDPYLAILKDFWYIQTGIGERNA